MSRASAKVVAALATLLVAIGGVAAATIERAATVEQVAERVVPEVRNVAVAFDTGAVDQAVADGVTRAMAEIGGFAARGRNASVGLIGITRNGALVHAPPAGYLIPMGVLSFPEWSVAGLIGPEVADVLDANTVVMNELSATTTGAAVGDVVELRAADGSPVSLVVGSIEPYDKVGFGEFVFTTAVADKLGITDDTRMVMWGFDDRAGLDRALVAHGVLGRRHTKVNRSWDPPDPDDSISTPRIKALVGEPWYRINANGSLSMHPTWIAENLTPGKILLDDTVRIRAQCNVAIVDDLRAALAEVAAIGLAGHIDLDNTNTFGGCYNPRYGRLSGYLSRHAYAVAIDMNTVSNCQGCVPQMDCRIVRIFRKHGFVWGGNYRVPDGMHFEWIDERRDQIPFASKYCPNIVAPGAAFVPMGSQVFTAGDSNHTHHGNDEHGHHHDHDHDGHDHD